MQTVDVEQGPPGGQLLPVYPLTEGLLQRHVRTLVKRALDECLDQLEEVFPPEYLAAHDLWSIRDALAELRRPGVARQQRLAAIVILRDDILAGGGPRDAQHPLGVVGRRNAPRPLRCVFKPQLDDLDRGVRRHEQAQALAQAMAVVFKHGVPCTVAHQVGCAGAAWRGGWLL